MKQTVKCPICGDPFVFYAHSAADQSACPSCVRKAREKRRRTVRQALRGSAMTASLPPEMALDAEPFTDDELDDALDQAGGLVGGDLLDSVVVETFVHANTDDDHPVRRWRIDGVGTAEWAMAMLATYEGRIAETERQADEMRARIDLWEREQTARSAAHAAFFRGHLERYALERREETGEKTLHLPSGKVATTEHRPKAAVEDDAAVAQWAALTLPEADRERVVRTTYKALVGELRTVVTLVEVPDEIVMANCGCIVNLNANLDPLPGADRTRLAVGSAAWCPSCGQESLVGQWHSTHLEVRDAKEGRPVPGTRVEPGHVTAKAVPGV